MHTDRRHLGGVFLERRVDHGAQLAGGCLRVGAMRQGRDDADAAGARGDHGLGIFGRDARNTAGREIADAMAKCLDDPAQAIEPDRRP